MKNAFRKTLSLSRVGLIVSPIIQATSSSNLPNQLVTHLFSIVIITMLSLMLLPLNTQAQTPLKKFTFGAFSWNGETLNSPQFLYGANTRFPNPANLNESIEHYLGFNMKMAKIIFRSKDKWINLSSTYPYDVSVGNLPTLSRFSDLH